MEIQTRSNVKVSAFEEKKPSLSNAEANKLLLTSLDSVARKRRAQERENVLARFRFAKDKTVIDNHKIVDNNRSGSAQKASTSKEKVSSAKKDVTPPKGKMPEIYASSISWLQAKLKDLDAQRVVATWKRAAHEDEIRDIETRQREIEREVEKLKKEVEAEVRKPDAEKLKREAAGTKEMLQRVVETEHRLSEAKNQFESVLKVSEKMLEKIREMTEDVKKSKELAGVIAVKSEEEVGKEEADISKESVVSGINLSLIHI
eukprot:TRINITY_DN5511_c0_g1_i7.p1 TRINITY_DN5511_c0_g1~~TRINITY_DN5511_c0_g1_i7.p1  ORF type:complete len:260 (+),score=47.39 TRINITY_DN5511_c0_g1_i7:204-983(+)